MRKSLLVVMAALALACGGVVGVGGLDASADADSGADASDDATAPLGFDDSGPQPDVRRYTDAPTFASDAACAGDALVGEAGAPFACGMTTCWSGASYCAEFSGGRILPEMGCHALPCDCVPATGCACVEPLPDFCTCDLSLGGITLKCSLP
jgi:hypothetical protein